MHLSPGGGGSSPSPAATSQKEMRTLGVSAQGAGTSAKRSVSLLGPAQQAEWPGTAYRIATLTAAQRGEVGSVV